MICPTLRALASSKRFARGLAELTLLCIPALVLCLQGASAQTPADTATSTPAHKPSVDPPAAKLTELSLEELTTLKVDTVYGASKHEQSVSEAPSEVSIVTSDDVKKFGYRTLADILRGVRGMYVTSDRTYTYIGIRGVNRPGDYGGRVLITVNGHRVNEPIYDQAFNGTEFPLDVDLIDRVEVIRGPGSSLYGNNAFFTVVNVITRTGKDLKGVEVSGAAASYDTFSGRLSYGNHFDNGLDLLASGTFFQSEGHEELFDPAAHGFAHSLDGSRAPSAWGSLSYNDFSIEGGYVDRRKDIPNAPFDFLFDVGPAWQEDKRGFGGLKFHHEFADDWQVSASAYYDYYRSTLLGPYDGTPLGLPGQPVFNRDIGSADWLDGELQASKTFFAYHRLTLGGDFSHDLGLRQRSYNVNPYSLTADVTSHRDMVGLYAQDEFNIRTNLILNAGVRYDYFNSFGDTVNPRAALIFKAFPTTTFKLIYGQAFRAPNAYESDYQFPGYLPNHDLKTEQIRSYEAAWEQGLGDHLQFTADLFYNDMHDLITQVYDTALDKFIFRNTDQVSARGVELELAGHWQSGLRGHISYTYTDARQDSGQASHQWLEDSPHSLGQLGFSVPLWRDKVFASLDAQAMSGRKTEAGSVPGFVTLDFTLFSRELLPGLEASASIYNLLDKRFSDPVSPDSGQAAIQQDGRTFQVKLTYRF